MILMKDVYDYDNKMRMMMISELGWTHLWRNEEVSERSICNRCRESETADISNKLLTNVVIPAQAMVLIRLTYITLESKCATTKRPLSSGQGNGTIH